MSWWYPDSNDNYGDTQIQMEITKVNSWTKNKIEVAYPSGKDETR